MHYWWMMIAKLHLMLQELKGAPMLYVQSRYSQCFGRVWSCKDTVFSLFPYSMDFVFWLFSFQCLLESYLLVLRLAARTLRSWLSWSTSSPTAFKKSVSMMPLIWSYSTRENKRILAWHVWQQLSIRAFSCIKVLLTWLHFFFIHFNRWQAFYVLWMTCHMGLVCRATFFVLVQFLISFPACYTARFLLMHSTNMLTCCILFSWNKYF